MGVEKEIISLEIFFGHVNYPLQPLHYETKVVLDTFFVEGGFQKLCDLAFAGYGKRIWGDGTEGLSWMDIGNSKPNGKVASALFRLLAPGGRLCNLLEAVSLPPKDFSERLKKSWKENLDGSTDNKFPFYAFDMPLSALYPASYELLAESADMNLYTLSRSRCPPTFLIPFWNPPLVTRFNAEYGQVLTSFSCSPISYFIWRMLFYLIRKAEECGVEMTRLPRVDTLGKKADMWIKHLMSYVRDFPSAELPLYHRLLTAYIQYFVSKSFIGRLSSKRSLEDVQWSTSDIVAALLLSAPMLLCMKRIRQPENEIYRTSSRNIVHAALLFKNIPFLTECVLALRQNDSEELFGSASQYSPLPRREICVDSLALSAWDILFIDVSFYRNTLVALRQSFISLGNFRDCRREHFNNSLELWYLLIKPNEKKELRETYVVHHYEIYSFFLIDVFTMILKSSFLAFIDLTGASMLARCFEVFCLTSVQNVFCEVNSVDTYSRSTVMETISQYFTLNWSDKDGSVCVLKVFEPRILDLAAGVYLAIEARLEKGDLQPLPRDSLKYSLSCLLNAFEGLPSVVEKCREKPASFHGLNASVPDVSTSSELRITLSPEREKDLFLKGIRRSCGFSGPLNLHFATEYDSLSWNYSPTIQMSFGNEFPCLIRITELMDIFLVKILETYYSAWIPTCSRGHRMWLLSTSKFTCINHPQESAIWECAFCEEVYGVCCRSNPYGRDGKNMVRNEKLRSDCAYCSECYTVLQTNSIFYTSSPPLAMLCPKCASRPFKMRSCRFLAGYKTWTIVVIAFLLIIFLKSI